MRSAPLASLRRPAAWHPARARERGQAFVEYALITSLIMVGLMLFGRSAMVALLQAYQVYMESFFFVLSLPIP